MLMLQQTVGDFVRLTLSSQGEEVKIDVHVKAARGRTIKLGFDAPRQVKIVRGKLLEEPEKQ